MIGLSQARRSFSLVERASSLRSLSDIAEERGFSATDGGINVQSNFWSFGFETRHNAIYYTTDYWATFSSHFINFEVKS